MKRFLLATFVFCALGGVVVAAATSTGKAPPAPTTRPTTRPVAINKFCAVDRDNPIDPDVATVTYKGKVIGFCCEDCIPKFKRNPEAYMKDLK